jgi:restriction system protein
MRRTRSTSLAAELLRLPWWASLALAATVFLLATIVGPLLSSQSGLFAPLVTSAAGTWGNAIAALLLVLSIGSAIRAVFARKLLDRQSSMDSIRSLSWQQFEILVAEAFRRRGYSILENGGGGPDGGVDVVLHKRGQEFLVQCKQWKARQIGVTTVRELKGVMATSGAAGGFVVCSGSFTNDARTFAAGAGIELIDGPALLRLIEEVRAQSEDSPADKRVPKVVSEAGPICPQCGSQMVMRTATRGTNAGSNFWGCTSFPKCRGTVKA